MAKVMLMSLGSRGDMEPFLAKAEELLKEDHEVALCMPAQFEGLASEVTATWFGMDKAFLDLIESPDVQKITGQIGSHLSRLRTILRLIRNTKGIQQQLIRDQKRAVDAFQPDRIVFHIKCIYPAMLGATGQSDVEMLSPIPCMIHPISEEPHIGFGKPRGVWWNRLTYRLANRVMIRKNILDFGGELAREWGVVHHGGSGTTHSALRFGLPQLIVPHIADQHFWARCIQRQGMGPQGFPINDLDRGKLESAFKELLDMA